MEQIKRTFINGRQKFNLGAGLLTMFLVLGLAFAACDAPAGAEGPQGPEGQVGSVGPAGEDGSQIYADEGTPAADVGDAGDYYLNQTTGELYGPKDSDGWGDPGIVLMGEDGQNGADGKDGEDGSQIHSGTGAPDASLGVVGDYYLDKDSYELYGPKTSDGWGTPLNLKGADGNANVTRYIFPGYDFAGVNNHFVRVTNVTSETEMRQSAWLIYVENSLGRVYNFPDYGYGGSTYYRVVYNWDSNSGDVICHIMVDGPGEEYVQIEVVRIEAGNTVDNRKQKSAIIPDHLDTSDYEAVAEYYGFGGDSKQ